MLLLSIFRRFTVPASIEGISLQNLQATVATPLPKASVYAVSQAFYKASLDFDRGVRQIPIGKASFGLLGDLTVHAFGEYVPLNLAAQIKVLSDSELQVKALDYSNTAPIEVAIRRSGLQATIVRDFDTLNIKLTGNVTDSLKTRLTDLQKTALAELAKAKTAGLNALKGRDQSQVEVVEKLYESHVKSIEATVNAKLPSA
jgi:ribosome recycling factor